jgi:PAS domain S-box-containing protein
MSPITAIGFALLGPSLLLLGLQRRWNHWLAQLLASVVAVVSIFGVLDFVLDPTTTHTHIAPPTALILLLLSFSWVLCRTNWGLGALLASASPGWESARRILPASIAVPIAIGWFGWKGQSAGLYSHWTGVALMIVSTAIMLTAITAWNAYVIDRTETERQRAQESVQRLAWIVTSSQDAIIGKTLDGIVTSWNPGAEAVYGYSAEEMIHHPVSVCIPPDRLDEFQAIMQQVRQGEPVRCCETSRIRKNGQKFEVSLSVSPLKDKSGKIIGVSTIARDITERKHAEEELREASLYTRSLIEASLDPLVTISREGKITDVNEATEKVTGVARERLIGSDFSSYFTEPETAQRGYEEVFAKGFVHDYPLAIRHTAGSVTDVLYNASIFQNERGEIAGVFAAARDITERKRAEDAFASAASASPSR